MKQKTQEKHVALQQGFRKKVIRERSGLRLHLISNTILGVCQVNQGLLQLLVGLCFSKKCQSFSTYDQVSSAHLLLPGWFVQRQGDKSDD